VLRSFPNNREFSSFFDFLTFWRPRINTSSSAVHLARQRLSDWAVLTVLFHYNSGDFCLLDAEKLDMDNSWRLYRIAECRRKKCLTYRRYFVCFSFRGLSQVKVALSHLQSASSVVVMSSLSFLQHVAILSAVLAIWQFCLTVCLSVCLSVSHTPILCQNQWT